MRNELLRMAGEKVAGQGHIEVRNPYNDAVVGTVPKATLQQVRETFEIAKAFQPTLSRFDRANILNRAADLVRAHARDRRADHRGIGPVPEGQHLRSRPSGRRADVRRQRVPA